MRDKPEISFLSSNNNFKKVNLEELTIKIGSGKTPKGGDANYQKSGIVLIRSQNIYNNKVNFKNIAYISPDVDATMINSRVLKGDVLLNITGASIGRSAVYKEEKIANVNQHVCIIRPTSKLDPYYLQLLLASEIGQKQISISQAGGGKEGLNFKQIAKMSFLIPSIEVQKKIGIFFKNFDETIALHQQELDALKKTKQGFLQKMFPKEGKNTPEIRFKGFKEEWREVLLGKITESYSGGTPSVGNKMYYNGIIPFIRSAEINSFTTELFLTEEGLKNSSAKLVDKGTILYAMYGATSGEVGISKIKGAINQAILAIQTKEEYDSQYVYQYLKKSKKSIVNSYLQGGQGNLSGAIIKKIPIWVPSNKIESKKIGEFFKQLDEVIDLKEKELKALKKTKQGFLQKMFV